MRRKYTITLSDNINQRLEEYSTMNGVSRSIVIETALDEFFEKSDSASTFNNDDLRLEMKQYNDRLKIVEKIISHPDEYIRTVLDSVSEEKKLDFGKMITQLDPDKMYRQSDLFPFLPDNMLFNSKKATVSRAVAQGFIETNGEKGKKCRIIGSSAINWLDKYRGFGKM